MVGFVATKWRGLRRRIDKALVDSDTWTDGTTHYGVVVARTARYRLAGLGLGVTRNERRLLDHKDRHKGERCFIIGNGPSLKETDLRRVKDEVTFGVNGIYLNYEKMGFLPTYYIVEDVFVAEDRADEINALQGCTRFFGNYLRYALEEREEAIWLNVRRNYRDYTDFPHFSRNAARMLWVGGTVSFLNLQMAYYMGFSKVYLVGFDHNYIVPDDVKKDGVDWESQSDDPNHFDPNYFGKGYRWHDPNVARMEKALCRARREFEADGRAVYNATVGGKLEVFERVDYDGLFPEG
ncbi:6-hydroxymethylpterin diphosphokinase MptE-like protein [Verrucomicrobiota bacterium]